LLALAFVHVVIPYGSLLHDAQEAEPEYAAVVE
jgi:hypothetical protein